MAGQSLNELGRCELAFLAFLSEHADDKENIPLNDFFAQIRDTDSDEEESVYEVCTPYFFNNTPYCAATKVQLKFSEH